MKKLEEFENTKKLIEQYKEFDSKVSKLEGKIRENENKANLRISKLEEEKSPTWEDQEFNINIEDVVKECDRQIKEVKDNLENENKALRDEIDQAKQQKKYFCTDENFKTVTQEIESMKKEVVQEELELKKKDIENLLMSL